MRRREISQEIAKWLWDMRELWWLDRLVADSARFALGQTVEGGCLHFVIPDFPRLCHWQINRAAFAALLTINRAFLLTMRATGRMT